jgi:xylulokinase
MRYLLGIDVGTSSTKTVLFDENCKSIASASEEYPLYQPQNGWAEQNPEDWYTAAVHTIQRVLKSSGISGAEVKGLGLSGQMHGLVMLDSKDEVIRPAIIWCDQRTAKECEEITQKVGASRLMEITANPALTGFTASKILWVRNHEPENYKKCSHILLPKDYVRFRLTGQYATEVSDASGMQLLDIPNRCWSEELLAKLEIDPALLPKVYESPEITGYLSSEAASLLGLTTNVVVAGGAGDNAAAAVGTGTVRDGRAFTTIGTSGVVFAHSSKITIDPKGRVHTFCCAVPGCWHVMGVTQAAGLSLSWYLDTFCADYKEKAKSLGMDFFEFVNREAASAPIGSNKLLYLPYLMGERTPHLDPDCRGVFFGLSAIHKQADLLRAVMEGVSYSLKDCQSILDEMGIKVDQMMACGGGSKSAFWQQILADMFNCPVQTAALQEGAVLGVAILAGVASGIFSDVADACDAIITTDKICQPIKENQDYYEKGHDVYCQIYGQIKDQFQQLANL